MAILPTDQLLIEANLIKNATIAGENTALRVGGTLVDMIDSQLVLPPAPIMSWYKSTGLTAHFADSGYDFAVGNPELFLFRYRGKRRSRVIDLLTSLPVARKKKARYVHPTTIDSVTKWAGWKFFAGEQRLRDSVIVNTRTTEWTLPGTIKPYEKFALSGFNEYMFWTELDNTAAPAYTVTQHDTNIFSGANYSLMSRINSSNATLLQNLAGTNRRMAKDNLFGKVTSYAFAVGIDNPNATKANGLCPKIFGAMSDPIFSILHSVDGSTNPTEVYMVNQVNSRYYRPVFK